MVLSAVFVPMAFFSGSVGIIYRQFSITIVSAMALSVLVALILTPALCATLLRGGKDHVAHRGPFAWFNKGFDASATVYRTGVAGILNRSIRFLLVFVLIGGGVAYLFQRLPSSFLPTEDQGILLTAVMLPAGATESRTEKVLTQVREYYQTKEKANVEGVFEVSGFGFSGTGQNVGIVFVKLTDFDKRKDPANSAMAIAGRAMGAFSQIRDGMAFALAPPAIQGFGTSGGFSFFLQDANNAGHDQLMGARNQLLGMAGQNKALVGTRPNGQEDTPQYAISIDQEKATALGISLSSIDSTLSVAWGGNYVNDFLDRGRVKKVYVQGNSGARMQPEDVDRWYVRNSGGDMVPFSAFSSGRWAYGSPRLERFNGLPAVEIQGQAAPGVSSGVAMTAVDDIITKLPPGYRHEWTGLSAQERISGNQAVALYAISFLVVFLALAALYESWSIPFAVMLSVPIGIFGALAAAYYFGQTNDIYFKVGLLTTMGLAAKNAILIVEFAIEGQRLGKGLVEATLDASRQRLRPILMTSLAFILGVLPLAIATGAGSGSQNSIGIGVMGGMIAATVLGIFFVPLLFVAVRRIFKGKTAPAAAASGGETPPAHA